MRKYLLPIGITFVVTSALAVTVTLSFLRTAWPQYQLDLVTWWSILSTVINLLLIGFSLWQYFEAEGQKKRSKAQVKIWMQDAKGVVLALGKIQNLKHTKVIDVYNSVSMVEPSAAALYQSLYEERVVKEEDYQEMEKKKSDILGEQELQKLKGQASSLGVNPVGLSSSTKTAKKG